MATGERISYAGAAAVLGVTLRSVYRHIQRGELTPVSVGQLDVGEVRALHAKLCERGEKREQLNFARELRLMREKLELLTRDLASARTKVAGLSQEVSSLRILIRSQHK